MYARYCKLRDSHGLKDGWVAKEAGITPSTFSDWKKGKSAPNAEKLVAIAKVLNTTVEYLVTGTESYVVENTITADEIEVLRKYRALNADARRVFDATLDALYAPIEKKDAPAKIA